MNWILQLPPPFIPDEKCPTFPYGEKRSADEPGFFAIQEEADVTTAIQDQVNKLGPDFDRSTLPSLYRLLWLLNNTSRHKSIQAYLGFMSSPPTRFGFFSEILLVPFDPERGKLIDLNSVGALASDLIRRMQIHCSRLVEDGRTCFRIKLTPIKTNFGQPPNTLWGYSLSLKAEALGDSKDECVTRWVKLLSTLTGVFEKTPAAA